MANSKSAEKRIRVERRNRIRNNGYKTKVKSSIKNVETLIAEGKKDEAIKALSIAQKNIDKAAINGVIHKNKAARNKSKIASKINSL